MEADLELDAWRGDWQAASPVVPDLKERVARQTRLMRLGGVAEVMVTIFIGGGALAWALLAPGTDTLVLTLGVWAFIAVAWTMSFLSRRGPWAPVTATTTAFCDLCILRCRRQREALITQVLLYVMMLVFDLIWIYFASARHPRVGAMAFLTSPAIAWVWVVTAALAVLALRQRRKLARELDALVSLRQQIGERAEGGILNIARRSAR